MKYLWQNKVLIILIIITIFLVPISISKPSQSQSDVIVTGVGVDKVDREYEVSIQYLVPTPESQFKQVLKVVSMKDKSFSLAVNKVVLFLGKHLGFTHCKLVVFSDSLKNENLTNIFDYLTRTKVNTYSINIINTNKSAKDFLLATINIEGNSFLMQQKSENVKDIQLYGSTLTMEDFYEEYLSSANCSIVSVAELVSKEEIEGKKGNSSDTSSLGSESEGSVDKIPVNNGKSVIIKGGKIYHYLDFNETNAFTYFDNDSHNGIIKISGVDDDYYENANIMCEISKKKLKTKVFFEDGKPVMELNLKANIRVMEINKENIDREELFSQGVVITEVLREKIKENIKNDMEMAIKISKEKEFDIINAYSNLYKYKTKEFKEYLSKLGEEEYYLKNIDFKINIEIEERT